jgi:hypothetical protein
MFNLIKYYYRKVNCYTTPELSSLANRHPHVEAIAMELNKFKDWDQWEDTRIDVLKDVKKNHVFTASTRNSNAMIV